MAGLTQRWLTLRILGDSFVWHGPALTTEMYTIHDKEPIPFALVQPNQQVKPFGRPATAKAPRAQPLSLKVDDIPGTRTKLHCFGTSPRLTNPVDPQYQWPRHQQPDAPVPKFIRNTLDTSDIPGSQVHSAFSIKPACIAAYHLLVVTWPLYSLDEQV